MNTQELNHFLDFVSRFRAVIKENANLSMLVVFLLIISLVFFLLGLSISTSNVTDRMNWLSYRLGLQIGKNIEINKIDINMTMFLRGLEDGRHDQSPLDIDQQVAHENEIMMIMECEKNIDRYSRDELMNNNIMPDKNIRQGIYKY